MRIGWLQQLLKIVEIILTLHIERLQSTYVKGTECIVEAYRFEFALSPKASADDRSMLLKRFRFIVFFCFFEVRRRTLDGSLPELGVHIP